PENAIVLTATVQEEADQTRVVATRSIDDLRPAALAIEKQPSVLRSVYESSIWIGAATELDEVLRRIGDAVLSLVTKATHVTIALRDDDEPDSRGGQRHATYVPVLTRVRGEHTGGAIPLTKSIFKKVVQERAAVLAADAPSEVGTASLLGANIRSTLG